VVIIATCTLSIVTTRVEPQNRRKPTSGLCVAAEGGQLERRVPMVAITQLQWQAKGEHPVNEALDHLRSLYAAGRRRLPEDTRVEGLGSVWRAELTSDDRDRAFCALEIATLFACAGRFGTARFGSSIR
jgi:hypothetical protein